MARKPLRPNGTDARRGDPLSSSQLARESSTLGDLQAIIRSMMERALRNVPLKLLLAHVAASRSPIRSAASTIRQFVAGRPLDSLDDLGALLEFFTGNPFGALLLVGPDAKNYNLSFLSQLAASQLDPPFDMCGTYFLYHTTIWDSALFTVSALQIESNGVGGCSLTEKLTNVDARSDSPDPINYSWNGIVAFARQTPFLLSQSVDQGLGTRMIICDHLEVHTGRPSFMFGRAFGISHDGNSYLRHVFLERVSSTFELMYRETRTTTFDRLTERQKAMFLALARWKSDLTVNEDPIGHLANEGPDWFLSKRKFYGVPAHAENATRSASPLASDDDQ